MIVLNNVSKRYGDKIILENFSHTFKDGEITVVHGPSGRGKTTLSRIIMALEKADEGDIEVKGRISAVFQEDRLVENLSLMSNLLLVTDDKDKAEKFISALSLDGNEREKVRKLSGGMKRRVAIIRALLVPFENLILDEPFSGLDDESKKQAVSLILKECVNKTLIVISHDSDDERLFKADSVLTL